ncbi:Uncharacterised protein [Enterobacter cloacae]|nr:Uncharacterised protein [Enterobacter cloacae]
MPANLIAEFRRTFNVDGIPHHQLTQVSDAQRLFH